MKARDKEGPQSSAHRRMLSPQATFGVVNAALA
jgi:hypothetical protein